MGVLQSIQALIISAVMFVNPLLLPPGLRTTQPKNQPTLLSEQAAKPVLCQVPNLCGGGTKTLQKWACDVAVCCETNGKWTYYYDGRKCETPKPTPTVKPKLVPQPVKIPTSIETRPVPHLDAMVIFNLINDYRVSRGLSRLQWNNDMCPFANKRLAQIHTDHSHSGFLAEIGKTYCTQCHHAGENLAGDVWTNEELVQGWIHSPTHLDDIVQPDYTVTCIATDTVGERTFAVQEFSSNY